MIIWMNYSRMKIYNIKIQNLKGKLRNVFKVKRPRFNKEKVT